MPTEDELVRAIKKVVAGDDPGVIVPVGDDAAVVDPGGHHTVVTVDTLVEGVHFDPDVMPPREVGYKAVAVNVSDIAAMGAGPRYGVVSLAVSGDVRPPWVMEALGGMREAADDYGMSLVGGDTVRSDRAVITVTVLGRVAKGKAVTRSGARPGDQILVTGAFGAAAGALLLMREGEKTGLGTDWGRALVAALFRPAARVGEGETLAQSGATALIDVSDGLALDLSRICEASEVGARVHLADVPVSPLLDELASHVKIDPLELALHGGEDYELIATIAPQAAEHAAAKVSDRFGTPATVIGEITASGLMAVESGGRERPLEPRGWDHFA